MSEWQAIDTRPIDGRKLLFHCPLGGCFIAPSTEWKELSLEEKRQLYEAGAGLPNVGWNPTHWMPLPSAPTGGKEG